LYNSDEMFEYFCTKNLVVFVALFMVDKTCSAPGPEKVDNSVRAATATEANSDENQDAGDANSKEEVLTTKFPVIPSHPATVG